MKYERLLGKSLRVLAADESCAHAALRRARLRLGALLILLQGTTDSY